MFTISLWSKLTTSIWGCFVLDRLSTNYKLFLIFQYFCND
jgi:hypothetical protein